jgi:hypothetical protein
MATAQAPPQADDKPVVTRAYAFHPSVGIQETITDNVALTAGDRRADSITRLFLGLEGEMNTGRATAELNAQFNYDAYARETERSDWSLDGVASASYQLVDELLAFRANGAVTNGAVSNFGVSATDRAGTPGRVQVVTYDVGPELTLRPADRVEIVAATRFAQVLYSSRDGFQVPEDDNIFQAVGHAHVGDRTRRVELRTSAEYVRDDRGYRAATAVQSVFVGATRDLRLIGRAGYDRIEQDQLRIRAPVLSAGFEYRPNSRSTITVEGGRRYDRQTWAADALVQLSQRLFLSGGYSENIVPDQLAVARSFRTFAEAGERLPRPLVPDSFVLAGNLYNETSLYRSADLRALFQGPVNAVGVTANWTERRFLQAGGRDRTLLGDAHFTRQLRPDLMLAVRANYVRTYESPRYGESRGYGASGQLAWRLNSVSDLSASVARRENRQLFPGGERITENAISAAFRRSF